MSRRTGILALLAVLASAWCAIAQTRHADTDSRTRMVKYFSDVPIGGPTDPAPPSFGDPTDGLPATATSALPVSYAGAPGDAGPSESPPAPSSSAAASPKPKRPLRLPTAIEGRPASPAKPSQGGAPMSLPGEEPAMEPPPKLRETAPASPRERPAAPAPPLPATPQPEPKPAAKTPVAKLPVAKKPASEVPPLETPAEKVPPDKGPAAKTPLPLPPVEQDAPAPPLPPALPSPLPPDTAYPSAPAMPEGPSGPRHEETLPEGPPSGESQASDVGCGAEGATCCGSCRADCADPAPGLLDPVGGPLGLRARGWLDQGVTINTFSPRNRSNLPVVYNDRSNDYQLYQLYMVLERPVDAEAGRWQIGGRVDLLYGTDHVYTEARGLELFRDGGAKWNSDNGPVGTNYGLSMPQLYMEVFAPWADGLSLKLGHFYTIMRYEVVQAPENFFYSHSYTFQYAEPITHTGLLAEYAVSGRLKLQAGLTRGWDNWEDNNNNLGFLGGLVWTSQDGQTSLALAMHTGSEADEPPNRRNARTVYSLVFEHHCSEQLTYVLQHDWGFEPRATAANRPGAWVGVNQYLLYKINPVWSAGLRFEWFYDKGGTRVIGSPLDPQRGHYFELTAGLNWSPRERLMVRPELRWDFSGGSDVHPFVDGTRDYQFLLAVDAIVSF